MKAAGLPIGSTSETSRSNLTAGVDGVWILSRLRKRTKSALGAISCLY
jgi:hypothetical protein